MVKSIIIIFLSILTCLSLVFATMQRAEVEVCRIHAMEARIQAEEALQSAQEQARLAQANAELAESMRILAVQLSNKGTTK